jgi:hypothetical protein
LPLLRDRTTPKQHRPISHLAVLVWAHPISLAATLGISFDFCAGGTKMFLFPPLPSRSGISRVTLRGCPIRTSTDQRVLGPSPSLLAAVLRPSSAPQRQGIHRPLSLAFALSAPSLLRLLCVTSAVYELGKVPPSSPHTSQHGSPGPCPGCFPHLSRDLPCKTDHETSGGWRRGGSNP